MTTYTAERPRALVVFESMFGNTEEAAHAVGRGLELGGFAVELLEVSDADESLPSEVQLLVVGAPTHAFSLSRPTTRADAVRQGAPADRGGVGLREWLSACRVGPDAPLVAAFDTRVSKVRWLPKAAGPRAVHLARGRGFRVVGKPGSFLVDDIKGPLLAGELEHAVAWGHAVAAACLEQRAAAAVAGVKQATQD